MDKGDQPAPTLRRIEVVANPLSGGVGPDVREKVGAILAEAGVTVELQRFSDQIHGFFNIVGFESTSRDANAEIAGKLRAALA